MRSEFELNQSRILWRGVDVEKYAEELYSVHLKSRRFHIANPTLEDQLISQLTLKRCGVIRREVEKWKAEHHLC